MRAIYPTCLVGLMIVGCAEGNTETGSSTAEGGAKSSSSKTSDGVGGSTGDSKARTGGDSGKGGAKQTTKQSGSTQVAEEGGSATGGSSSRRTSKATGGGGNPNTKDSSTESSGGSSESSKSEAGGAKPVGGSAAAGGSKASGGSRAAGGSNASGGSAAVGGSSATTTTKPNPNKKFVGNITTGANASLDAGGKTYSKYWDQVTPENAGKWGSVQSSAGSSFNWGTLDAIYDYTQKNNILFKQHTFIWGAQQPSGSPTQAQVQNWMQSFCKRYPNVKIIDVVNEPPPHTTPSYANNIGGGTNGDWKWIANAFTWAREACPNAILVLNDYNNIEWTKDSAHFVDIVKAIQKLNAPIDAVGAQSHDLDHAEVTSDLVKSLLTKLHEDTGLPVYITELDLDTSDDAKQLQYYKTYFPMFWEPEWIPGITIWGWIYGQTWSMAPNSGLVKNGTFRPAMTWLMEQIGRPTS